MDHRRWVDGCGHRRKSHDVAEEDGGKGAVAGGQDAADAVAQAVPRTGRLGRLKVVGARNAREHVTDPQLAHWGLPRFGTRGVLGPRAPEAVGVLLEQRDEGRRDVPWEYIGDQAMGQRPLRLEPLLLLKQLLIQPLGLRFALLQKPPALRELVHQLGEGDVQQEPGEVGAEPVEDRVPRFRQPRLLGRDVPRVHRPLHNAQRQTEEEGECDPPERGAAGGLLHPMLDLLDVHEGDEAGGPRSSAKEPEGRQDAEARTVGCEVPGKPGPFR